MPWVEEGRATARDEWAQSGSRLNDGRTRGKYAGVRTVKEGSKKRGVVHKTERYI